MIAVVHVGVALSRPPTLDRVSRVVVSVDCDSWADVWAAELEAKLLATWIASARPDVVMPVWAEVVELLEV